MLSVISCNGSSTFKAVLQAQFAAKYNMECVVMHMVATMYKNVCYFCILWQPVIVQLASCSQ